MKLFFESSGTGGLKSKHFIKDLELYNRSIEECFKNFYGEISVYYKGEEKKVISF